MAVQASYPRELAVRVLTRVLSDAQPLDEALAELSATASLSPQARGWLTEVCSGTLRWKGRLDQVIDSTALKKKPSGWLRKILLIAAYQLVVQERTSAGAVVSETVAAVKKKEGEAPGKFANACLRKVADHAQSWRSLELPAGASARDAAAWASLPDWLWERIQKQRGPEWARAFSSACLERPVTWIRARNSQWKPDPALGAEPGGAPGAFRLGQGGAISEMGGFREGEFFVQDISSQTLVEEAAKFAQKTAGNGPWTALDLCAAPGGKSLGMAWSGFRVTATDRDERRLELVRENVERLRAGDLVRVVPRAEVEALPAQTLVWVDAPCTGTGIIRRHPDVRWLRREKDLESLTKLQAQLLEEAAGKVAPGGLLMYSVCSVLEEEGARVVAGFLESPAGKAFQRLQDWLLAPQDQPRGDGFQATLLQCRSAK